MTPPPRASKNPDKIKYVLLVNGRWVFRPYIPVKKRKGLNVDKFGYLTPILLGKESDPWHRILAAHAGAVEQLEVSRDSKTYTLDWVAERYEESDKYKKLSTGTHKKNKTLKRVLDHKIKVGGQPTRLGAVRSTQLSKPIVNTIRAKRLAALQENGKDGYSHINREITYLSTITGWASNHYEQITGNPFLVERYEENVSTRYVTDAEYIEQYNLAHEAADYLPVVLELTYLLSSRGCESIAVEMDHLMNDDNGNACIFVNRVKGSESNLIQIGPRLQAAIDEAMELRRSRKIVGKYLIPGTNGPKLKKSTLDDAMQRLKRLMAKRKMQSKHSNKGRPRDSEYSPLFWRLHDLKRKGVSDSADDRIAGHKSESMRDRYSTKLKSFNTPE